MRAISLRILPLRPAGRAGGSAGPGAATDKRVPWSRQLSTRQARHYTPEKILGKHRGEYWFLSRTEKVFATE
jgi:hypothetical protein